MENIIPNLNESAYHIIQFCMNFAKSIMQLFTLFKIIVTDISIIMIVFYRLCMIYHTFFKLARNKYLHGFVTN